MEQSHGAVAQLQDSITENPRAATCLETTANSKTPRVIDSPKTTKGLNDARRWTVSMCLWQSTTTHHAPGYWDQLSKISLTHRALKEFDRRAALKVSSKVALKKKKQILFQGSTSLDLINSSQSLKRFARTGGPDLSDIIAYPQPEPVAVTSICSSKRLIAVTDMAPSRKATVSAGAAVERTNNTSASGRSSAYDPDFMTLLAQRNIERPDFEKEPVNLDQLMDRLKRPRSELTPSHFSQAQLVTFRRTIKNAVDENMIMGKVLSTIMGDDHDYPSTLNRQCENWQPFTDGKLVIPRPNFFDGVRQGPKNRQVRNVLNTLIVPSISDDWPFLPNFFGEAKSPKGSGLVAQRQACYDGAFGARAMHHLTNYGAEETYDNKAYTFTFVYSLGFLEIYAHHMSQSGGPKTLPCYHMIRLGAWDLQGSRQSFIDGATAFRNLRDLAAELREELLATAESRMQGISKEMREKYIAEAIQRVQESLPEIESSESQGSSQPQSGGNESSLNLFSDAGNDSDVTVTPEKRLRIRPQKHKTTLKGLRITAGPRNGVRKTPARTAKARLTLTANSKARAQQGF